jgi:osmoprotectant transport system permease protein
MMEPGFLSQVAEWFTDDGRWRGVAGIPWRTLQHLLTSFASVGAAFLVAFPLGTWIGHRRRLEFLVVSVANLGRAIPSFGLLLLFATVFGTGLKYPPSLRPAILFAMILLAIPPILTNTYVGIQQTDPDTLEAARGMGLSEWQALRQIELPLAAPLVVAGLRTAAVQVVATATLAAVVAGGGLGRFIVDGFATRNRPQIFGGALLVAALAILVELGFGLVERWVSPRMSSRERKARLEPEPAAETAPAA